MSPEAPPSHSKRESGGEGRPVLVVAVGNPLRGDDGAGAAVAAGLEAEGLRVLALHQLAPEVADDVAGASAVVFVDAREGGRAGEVRVERLAPGAGRHAFSHAVAPEVVLALAERLHAARPPAALVTITGSDFSAGEALSPEVRAALPEARARVRELAASLAPAA